MKIILFLSLLIWVIPGFGKVKIQKVCISIFVRQIIL